jgi:hypothetical protein
MRRSLATLVALTLSTVSGAKHGAISGTLTDEAGEPAIGAQLRVGKYRAAAVTGLEQGEWYDPAVLDQLLASAVPVSIAGVEKKTQDLVIRDRP